MKAKIIDKQNMILLLCVFLTAILNQPLLEEGLPRTVRGLLVSFAYIALAICWSISILDRIRGKQSRRIMIGIVGLILFWLIVRACKYEIWDDTLDIALWYLFYVPQTFLPLLIFNMTLHIEGRKGPVWERLLYVPAALIVFGILTNNTHQLAFRFTDAVSSKSGAYSYGILYYISIIWMIFFMLAAIINAIKKSRLLHKKKAFVLLLIWLLVPVLYLIYYQFGPLFMRTYFFNFPEGCCFLYVVFLEICVQLGMILSNRQHEEIFAKSSIIAEITENNGDIVSQSKTPLTASDKEKNTSKDHSIIVHDAYELRCNRITGGFVYWLNDIRELLEVNQSLKELGEELAEEHNILEAEIAAKEKKTTLEEQNRIYDNVNAALTHRRELLLELLNDKKQILKALVLAVYMKRKGNLVILSKQTPKADIRELGLCVNESFSYTGFKGCICNCTVSGEGVVSVEILASFYDVFEEVLEQTFDRLEAFLCYIKCNNDAVTMRCQIECQDDFTIATEQFQPILSNTGIEMTIEKQDATLYLNCKARGENV